jgi:hypothetical protein
VESERRASGGEDLDNGRAQGLAGLRGIDRKRGAWGGECSGVAVSLFVGSAMSERNDIVLSGMGRLWLNMTILM